MINYDITIIGGGVIGCAISRELSKYNLKVCLIEKEKDLAMHTSKGNSGLIHGGFDPRPETQKAKYNIEGRKLFETDYFVNLDFPYRKINSLILAYNNDDLTEIKKLYEQGLENGLLAEQMQIIEQTKLREIEPNVNSQALWALQCSCSYLVDPVALTKALAKNAFDNNVEFFLDEKVENISKKNNLFTIKTSQKTINSKVIINAAGVCAQHICELYASAPFKIKTRRGEYKILSSSEYSKVKNVCFLPPSKYGKGVIVAPMLSNNVLVGPSAVEDVSIEDTRIVNKSNLELISGIARKIIPSIDTNRFETVLAGTRALILENNDFHIKSLEEDNTFINVAGIQSPGLSSAPAIAQVVTKMIKEIFKDPSLNPNFNPIYSKKYPF